MPCRHESQAKRRKPALVQQQDHLGLLRASPGLKAEGSSSSEFKANNTRTLKLRLCHATPSTYDDELALLVQLNARSAPHPF